MMKYPKDSKCFQSPWAITKLVPLIFLLILMSYLFYTIGFLIFKNSHECDKKPYTISLIKNLFEQTPKLPFEEKTNISHIVFGIGASSKLWKHRKEYIKLWWRNNETRGIVWLDKEVKIEPSEENLVPTLKISSDTSKFKYENTHGDRSGIRISRIVSETVRLGMENVRWFVMGDDDTFFVIDNLVKVLQKYDHNQFYYIGAVSESHYQNIYFSYNMAYGGGGFAISYPLAVELEKMQDRCIQRYPKLYGSDDRVQACMAELGVPLTLEKGFHQFDVYGSVFGLLAAHRVTPLVSLHHLDLIEPIFPNMSQVQALQKFKDPIKMDSYGLMQQSICYDENHQWTVSVSWGYAVQIFRGIFSARDMERPARTFLNWYREANYKGYPFNTRSFSRNDCQKPFIFHLSNATYDVMTNETVTRYIKIQPKPNPKCKWKMEDPAQIQMVEVYKKPDPYLWDKSPRRNCCRVQSKKEDGTLVIDVGKCREHEVVEL